MTAPYDVAVVGGGLAGAASCISARQHGLRVAWVAPEATQVPVGDSLSAAATPVMRSLGLLSLLADSAHRAENTVFSAWGQEQLRERHSFSSPLGAGCVVSRAVFEAAVRERVPKAVDRWFFACRSCKPYQGEWELQLDGGQSLRARSLVDATGRRSMIGRQFSSLRRTDRLVALSAVLKQGDSSITATPATIIESVRQGWWYVALLADGRLSLFYFSDPDLLPRQPTASAATLNELVGETRWVGTWLRELGAEYVEPARLHSAGTTWLFEPCGQQEGALWLAAGDAAVAMDPLSSHGMASALWAGWRSGRVIHDFHDARPDSLLRYRAAIESGRQQFLVNRKRIYSMEQRFAQSLFWQRRQMSEY